MRFFLSLVLALGAVLLPFGGPTPGLVWAQTGPDGTSQVEAGSETLRYADAATPQLLTHYWIVLYEVDALPQHPSPDQVKASQLRKRMLDLRLAMDLVAFAYEPGQFEAYRDAIDEAYEQVGKYKDLFDIQEIDGLPIDPVVEAERLAKMNVALAPLRLPSFREDLKHFVHQHTAGPLSLEFKAQPRLWQIARTGPNDSLDSVGNAGLLGHTVLRNLRAEGLLVGDIFDPAQEARFHDVRKALRSILVLSDMFPSLSAQTADAREPLAKLVKAYGKTNDQIIAYRLAETRGGDRQLRADEVRAAFAKAQALAAEFVDSGQLEAYASRLAAVQVAHGR